ncbi:MAG: copper-containing amine oxidase, partial [Propionibacteriaceae bacterium]|nr:copper-containing amine oxidase [Propionibacteriaceae bacterium]
TEFQSTAAILRRDQGVTDSWRFASIELKEPAKVDVKAWRPGDAVPRRSLSVLWNRQTNQTYEAVVDLVADRVDSWIHRPGVCPNFTIDEYHDVDEALHKHPEVLARLEARGIADPSLVLFDVWTYGKAMMPEQWGDRRLGWCDLWMRETPEGNPYAHPVSGLKIIVDMNTLEVLEIEDHHDYGLPEVDGEYDPRVRGTQQRTDLKPLEISQPEGVSFIIDGNELRWQNWSLRLGFNFREGPVIYQVAFDDQGTRRDVAYRMSFAEMVVPYRDPGFDHYRRTAFDIGEWGLGYMTTSLELGCDCLGEIVYVDAVVPDTHAEPVVIERAVCLHEEDNAVLWKHVDSETGAEVRRMRRMVISAHVSVANYEYLVYWRFYQDGNIECEIRATGLMVTTPMQADSDSSPYGTTVDRRTYAPFHQHFVVAKLDLDIDGEENTVVEVDSVAASIGDGNPYGLALSTQTTTIESESQAARDFNWEAQRSWKVINPNKTNRHGSNTAYKLVPGAAIPALLDSSSPVYQRAPVIGHCVWVTAYDDNERWPAGDYPTQSSEDTGITRWITDDAPLVGTDVVLWYVFGIHHITRAEDWPIMPVDIISFWLKPFGFFDRNPSLDVPNTMSSNGGHSHPEHAGR